MFSEILSPLIDLFKEILSVVLAMIAIAVSMALAILAYKQQRKALFLSAPDLNEKYGDLFKDYYQDNKQLFSNYKEAAESFYNIVQRSAEYEYLYGRKIRAKELYLERQDSFKYLKHLQKRVA